MPLFSSFSTPAILPIIRRCDRTRTARVIATWWGVSRGNVPHFVNSQRSWVATYLCVALMRMMLPISFAFAFALQTSSKSSHSIDFRPLIVSITWIQKVVLLLIDVNNIFRQTIGKTDRWICKILYKIISCENNQENSSRKVVRYLRIPLLDNLTCQLCIRMRSMEMLLHLKRCTRKYNQGKSQHRLFNIGCIFLETTKKDQLSRHHHVSYISNKNDTYLLFGFNWAIIY